MNEGFDSDGKRRQCQVKGLVHRRRVSGFTLVELMIVVVIMGLALSLVGPLTIQQLDNARRNQEREQLNQYLQDWRFYAQQRHRAVVLSTNGQRLNVYLRSDYVQQQELEGYALAIYHFDHLNFPRQSVHINANGFWQSPGINWYEQRGGDASPMHKELVNRGMIESG